MLSFLSLIKNDDDLQFMEQLFEEHERLMYSMAKCYAHDKNLVEDIVQDSLLNLIKNISVLRRLDRCILTSYIVTTVRNTAYSEHRKAKRRSRVHASLPQAEDEPVDPLSLEDLNHLLFRRYTLSAAWKQLSDRDQILLYGKYFIDLSDEKLSTILDCKPGSIRMLMSRARRNLAELIQKMEDKQI